MTQKEAIQSIEETYRLNKYDLRLIDKKDKRIFVGQLVWDAIQHTGMLKDKNLFYAGSKIFYKGVQIQLIK
jgi:hypothetical protein